MTTKFISTKQAADDIDATDSWVRNLCRMGRIPGAQRVAGVWVVPEDFSVLPSRKGTALPYPHVHASR